jgi:hypothetical protein
LRSDAATRAAPDDMVASNTVGEFVRSTIGAGLRKPSGLLEPLTLTPPV